MKRLFFLIIFFVGGVNSYGQFKYKVELDYKFTSTISDGSTFCSLKPYNGNASLDDDFFEIEFSFTQGTATKVKDAVVDYPLPITRFGYISSYYESSSVCPFNMEAFSSFEGSTCTFLAIGNPTCVPPVQGFQSLTKVFPLENIKDLNNLDNNLASLKACENKLITISSICDFHYSIVAEYTDPSTGALITQTILPYDHHPSDFSLSVGKIPGLTAGTPFTLQVYYVETPTAAEKSDKLNLEYIDCSPFLTQPIQPTNTTCSYGNDGGFDMEIERDLAANEELVVELHYYDLVSNDWELVLNGVRALTSSDFINQSYTWNDLSPNEYKIIYHSTISGQNLTPIEPAPFIIDAPDPVTFNFTKTEIKCSGETNGTITFSNPSGGSNTGFQYSIDNGTSWQGSDTFTGLGPVSYNLAVKDSNGCIPEGATPEVILVNPLAISITPITINNPSASDATDGGIDVDVADGTGALTYEWKKDGLVYATTQDLASLGAGAYVLTVKDANDCTATFSQTLTEPPPLTITFSVIQAIDCHGDNGSIKAQGAGGNAGAYTYLWQNNSTNQNLLNVPAGTYQVTVKDSKGVEVIDSYTLTEPDALSVTTSVTNVKCNNGSDGAIDMTITGGTTPYTVQWNDNATTMEDRTELAQGEYFYTIEDANTCQVNGSVTISQPAVLEITLADIQHPTVSGGTDGLIDVGISGGTTNYTFEWTDASSTVVGTTEDMNNLGDGNYTLVVTDANYNTTADNAGCTATISVLLTEPQPLSATITETNPISCFGDNDGELAANPIGGTAGYNYEWFKEVSGTYETLSITTQTITDLAIGNYRVVVKDALNSQVQIDYSLTEPVELAVTFTTQNINCFGGSDGAINNSPSGGTQPYFFSWTNTSGTEVSISEDLSGVSVGNYTIEIADTRGCTIQQAIELTAPTEVISITLEELKKPTASGAADGFIHVSITGGNGGYSYQWADNSNTQISTEEDLNNIGEGVYTLTVKDSNASSTSDNAGCILMQNFTITAPDAINIVLSETSSVLCNGAANGEISATVSGGFLNVASDYTYQWFKEENGSLVEINQITRTASSLSAGAFTLTVTDDNGIIKNETYTLAEPELLDIALIVTRTVSCLTGAGGAISATVSGGTAPYNYLWSNGATTLDAADLTVGNYTLTITDSNGCELSENIDVIQPGGMTIETITNPPSCSGSSDGSIALVVSGGKPPYTYLWNTSDVDATINNLVAGSYNVTITDNEGCIALQNYVIEDPELLTIDLGEDRVLCQGQSHHLDITIDDENASYLWSSNTGFSSTSPIVAITNGIYTATVTNKDGCMATGTVTVSAVEETISADFLVSTQVFVGETIIVVDVSDPEPDAVTWGFSEGTIVVSQNSDYAELEFQDEGTYYVTMTATRGACQEVLTKEIIVQPRTDFGVEQGKQSSFIREFKSYPNPSNGIFQIDVELEVAATVSIKIITLSNEVIHAKVMSGEDNYSVDYNLSAAAGTYMVLLETPKGSSIRKIIIE